MNTETEEFPATSVNSDRIARLHILNDINLKASNRFIDYLACLIPIIYFEVIFLKVCMASSYQVTRFLGTLN